MKIKLLILFIYGLYTVFGMEIYSPSNIAGTYNSYGIFWGKSPKQFNVTGQVILGSPQHGCSKFKNADEISGNIVLIDKDGCYVQEKMKHAQEAGAIGCMVRSFQFHGQANYLYDGHKHPDLNIATVEVSIEDYTTIKKEIDNGVYVTIEPDDNPFDWMYRPQIYATWMAIFIPWNAGLIALAGYRYYGFVQKYGFEKSVTQLSLILLMLSRVTPLIWSFDPEGWLQVFPSQFSSICASAFFPFILGAYLMLAFYWYQLTSKIQQFSSVLPKLDKMKIPFMVVFFIILGLEVGTWPPRALHLDTVAVIAVVVVYFTITMLAASIFYFIQAYRILKVFHQNQGQKVSTKSRNLKKVTILIIVTGICYTLAAILTGALGTTLKTPQSIITLFYTVYPLFAMGVTTQILIFNPNGSKNTSSSPDNSNTKKWSTNTDSKDVTIMDSGTLSDEL